MAFVTGLFLIDAPASALNNMGAAPGATTDNAIAVKKIRTPRGAFPYVSAQAFRYWIRTTLEETESRWIAAPVFREGKIAYTDANPLRNWDDDLFGYMRAPSRRADATKDERATPLEARRDITRISPFKVSTLVSVTPTAIVSDFGTMARQDGDPVPHEHEFYRAHLQGLLSIDLTAAGTFFDGERVGFRNLDTYRRDEAEEAGCEVVMVRGQEARRMPMTDRMERVATLVRAFGALNGGAKQTLHYTDVTPAVIAMASISHGNNPFYRMFGVSSSNQTMFHTDAFRESLEAHADSFQSDIYIGWATGFLDEERQKLEHLLEADELPVGLHLGHPRDTIRQFADALEDERNAGWYE